MTRLGEIELLASFLAEPTRGLVQAALAAFRRGRFESDRIAELARRKPDLRWLGFLLALEATELRQAGATRITTPRTRFVTVGDGGFREKWSPFWIRAWPEGSTASLDLAPEESHYRLTCESVNPQDGGPPTDLCDAVEVLARELEAWLGVHVPVTFDGHDAGRFIGTKRPGLVSSGVRERAGREGTESLVQGPSSDRCRTKGHAVVFRYLQDLEPNRGESFCMRCRRIVDGELGDNWSEAAR